MGECNRAAAQKIRPPRIHTAQPKGFVKGRKKTGLAALFAPKNEEPDEEEEEEEELAELEAASQIVPPGSMPGTVALGSSESFLPTTNRNNLQGKMQK